MDKLSQALHDIFGFSQFRPHQKEIVSAIMESRDVFAVMPTGGGKSLCYQLPACLKSGITLIISPLISLMKDQVDAANANGIGATSLNSTLTEKEKKDIYSDIRAGNIKLLYVSPERFNSGGFLDYLKTLPLAFFAIDEAHCISEWGHDFRPDYLSLANMTRVFPDIPVAAFTATATPRVSEDIVSRLGLRNPHLTRASFNRPNLSYRIQPKEDLEEQLIEFVREHGDEAGIIYRTTRKSVDATTALLRKHGIDALSYHAGLTDKQRHDSQEAFRHDRCQVVVATIAFGMGIDKPNVRYVVHGDLPKNIEGYYQETGRAGRDGEPAQCLLFHSSADIAQLMRFNAGIEDPVAKEAAAEQLQKMASFARADYCRRAGLLAYFGENYPEANCASCDVCLGEAEREDATIEAQKALSAIARTGGRFGAVHLADILIGNETDKIRQRGHHRLPTFGVGRDRDKQYWRRVIEALIAKGYAEVEEGQYPTPNITEQGWELLRGGSFEMLKTYSGKAGGGSGSGTGRRRRARPSYDHLPHNKDFFQELRKERMRIATERGMPPYIVISDRGLMDIARIFPRTEDELLLVNGIGQTKLKEYGEIWLRLVENFLSRHPEARPAEAKVPPRSVPLSTEPRPRTGPPDAPRRKTEKTGDGISGTEEATRELLEKGMSIEEVAARRSLRPDTVVQHIEKLCKAGVAFRPEQFMEPERFDMIRRMFTDSGQTLLRPVVEASGESISYLEAKLVRIFL